MSIIIKPHFKVITFTVLFVCLLITSCKNKIETTHGDVTITTKNGDSITFIDLGLPSGTKWADRNMGATNSWDYGDYYAFGETHTKSTYTWATYLDGKILSYCDCGTSNDLLNGILDISGSEYDAATVNWGNDCKIPTKEQWYELNNSSLTTWTWCDGETVKYDSSTVKGYIVTSKVKGFSNKSIFLPVASDKHGSNVRNVGTDGYYWSSLKTDAYPGIAWDMYFSSNYHTPRNGVRYDGRSIRAVINK